jgi:hypothetical protein
MLLAYFDEVKPCEGQPYYWIGGLMVNPVVVPVLESELNALADACFGPSAGLTKETEFHATNIWSGTRNFKRLRDPVKRSEILKNLLSVARRRDGVFHVAVRMDIARLTAMADSDVEPTALMYLIERVNRFARKQGTQALLIGDLENERVVNRSVADLAEYRTGGTRFAYGGPIDNVIDTIHFAQSHHSRMLQLADVCMWYRQLTSRTDAQTSLRRALVLSCREIDMGLATYKFWPSSWGRDGHDAHHQRQTQRTLRYFGRIQHVLET